MLTNARIKRVKAVSPGFLSLASNTLLCPMCTKGKLLKWPMYHVATKVKACSHMKHFILLHFDKYYVQQQAKLNRLTGMKYVHAKAGANLEKSFSNTFSSYPFLQPVRFFFHLTNSLPPSLLLQFHLPLSKMQLFIFPNPLPRSYLEGCHQTKP